MKKPTENAAVKKLRKAIEKRDRAQRKYQQMRENSPGWKEAERLLEEWGKEQEAKFKALQPLLARLREEDRTHPNLPEWF